MRDLGLLQVAFQKLKALQACALMCVCFRVDRLSGVEGENLKLFVRFCMFEQVEKRLFLCSKWVAFGEQQTGHVSSVVVQTCSNEQLLGAKDSLGNHNLPF